MPKSPLEDLPPADPKAFRRAIKLNLERALQSLAKFSDSVRAGRPPDWPPNSAYTLFIAQLRNFGLISKRKKNAPAIQLIREIDHRWPKLKAFKTLANCADQLNNYLCPNLLGEAIEKAQFGRRNDPRTKHLIALVFREKSAAPEDLGLIRDLLPKVFQKLFDVVFERLVKSAPGLSHRAAQETRTAFAQLAQEYLISEHQTFLAKLAAARALRQFLFDLRYKLYTKHLFGFSTKQIKEWSKVDLREAKRLRKRRFDQKKRAKTRYASR